MDDFNTFKASREKMDPTSRKMSEHQWQQAYTAYRSARERVTGGGQSEGKSGGKTKKRRQSNTKVSAGGARRPSNGSDIGSLRHKIRGQSAYADLRMLVDFLAWIALGLLVLSGVLALFYYTSVPVTLASLLSTLVQVIGIIVARLLIQVLIDIPDIALYRAHRELAPSSPSSHD